MPLTETRGTGISGCLADSLRSDPSVAGGARARRQRRLGGSYRQLPRGAIVYTSPPATEGSERSESAKHPLIPVPRVSVSGIQFI